MKFLLPALLIACLEQSAFAGSTSTAEKIHHDKINTSVTARRMGGKQHKHKNKHAHSMNNDEAKERSSAHPNTGRMLDKKHVRNHISNETPLPPTTPSAVKQFNVGGDKHGKKRYVGPNVNNNASTGIHYLDKGVRNQNYDTHIVGGNNANVGEYPYFGKFCPHV